MCARFPQRQGYERFRSQSASAPVLLLQSLDVAPDNRAALTDDALRDAFLPVTAEAQAQFLERFRKLSP